jgi:thiamine biosynthesis protein ThiC
VSLCVFVAPLHQTTTIQSEPAVVGRNFLVKINANGQRRYLPRRRVEKSIWACRWEQMIMDLSTGKNIHETGWIIRNSPGTYWDRAYLSSFGESMEDLTCREMFRN